MSRHLVARSRRAELAFGIAADLFAHLVVDLRMSFRIARGVGIHGRSRSSSTTPTSWTAIMTEPPSRRPFAIGPGGIELVAPGEQFAT